MDFGRGNHIFLIVFTLFVIAYPTTDAVLCEKVVTVVAEEFKRYLGSITFPAPKAFTGQWEMDMKTDVPYLFLGGWGVIIDASGPDQNATFYSKDDVTVKAVHKCDHCAGDPITFRFRMSYMPDSPFPRISELTWEKERICYTPKSPAIAIDNSIVKLKKQSNLKYRY